jgi:hypothetical protein
VLYVEDNPTNVHLVTRLLDKRPEVELIVANTGEEGFLGKPFDMSELLAVVGRFCM